MAGTKQIPLTKGQFATIDAEDYGRIMAMGKWHLSSTGYAVQRSRINGKLYTIRMHRVLNKTPDGSITDHLNGNPLDNRKSNLRTASFLQNSQNRHSTKGYSWDESKHLWLVRYKGVFYGRYKTEAEAQEAYKLARAGVIKSSKEHPRRRFLPKGVQFMQPNAERDKPAFYIRVTINGERHFKGYYASINEAVKGLKAYKKGRIVS